MDRKEQNREYMRQRREDPEFRAREAARMRNLRKDPAYRKKEKPGKCEYERRRYATDEGYRARELARKNTLRAKQRAVPEYRAEELHRSRVRRRTKYASDAQYREGRKALRRVWYAANRDKAIQSVRENYSKCREKIIAAYRSICACCGEHEPMFLELDHINGGGAKDYREAKSPLTLYRRVVKEGFPDHFRLLCSNCNRGRHRNGGICPHQIGKEV